MGEFPRVTGSTQTCVQHTINTDCLVCDVFVTAGFHTGFFAGGGGGGDILKT